jgi:hypothetical protein
MVASPADAHVVSMSTGELRVQGTSATYELRIPMYEVAHVANPEAALLDHMTFARAVRKSAGCRAEGETYVCQATYDVPTPFDRIEATCTLFQVTVPNHVHLLRAIQGENSDQAVFDQSFIRAEIRFHPPSRAEQIAGELGTGAWRAITSVEGVLFLVALAIAARTGREAALLAAMFLIGEWIARPLAPRIPWQLSPRFIEAAMSLTVAYLAVEMLALPRAGQRWVVVLVLGLFHGLYFAGFPATYLMGAAGVQVAGIGVLAAVALRLPRVIGRYAARLLLVTGVAWFAVRLVR